MATRQTRVTTPASSVVAALVAMVSCIASAQQPSRIVSLVPSVTEMLFAIGAGPRVVGVSSFDDYPPAVAGIAKVGGLIDPDVERLLSLAPDLVVVYTTQTDLRTQLDRAGIGQFLYTNTSLPGVSTMMRELGTRLGLASQSARAADEFERRLDSIRDRVAGRARPRVLLVYGHDPRSLRSVNASGRAGFHHEMLEVAGAVNVLGDIDRTTIQMTTEEILRLGPDVIIDLHYGNAVPSDLDAEDAIWGRLSAVPAVRTGRVHVLAGDEFVVPGPRLAAATEQLARALHPEAFTNATSNEQ